MNELKDKARKICNEQIKAIEDLYTLEHKELIKRYRGKVKYKTIGITGLIKNAKEIK